MRYAEAQYGEFATAVGEFTTGRDVTIELYSLPAGTPVGLDDADCDEIGTTGIFIWSSGNIMTQPTGYTELLYVMTDVTPIVGTGRTHKGKIIFGGYPSDAARSAFRGGFVYIDVDNGFPGEGYQIGTPAKPSNNVPDARTIALRENLNAFYINGSITIAEDLVTPGNNDYTDWSFQGLNPINDVVVVESGVDVGGSKFELCSVRGDLTGVITALGCRLGGPGLTPLTGIFGIFVDCGFVGTLRLADQAQTHVINGYTSLTDFASPARWSFEDVSSEALLNMQWTGPVQFYAVSNAFDQILVYGRGTQVEISNTVDAGNFYLYGIGELLNLSLGTTTLIDNFVRGSRIDVATGTRATQAQILSDAVPFNGADVTFIRDVLEATSEYDQSTDPWEEKWIRQSDLVVLVTFKLYDEALNAINASNPMTGKRVRRRLKV
jgi:hypothetical protein